MVLSGGKHDRDEDQRDQDDRAEHAGPLDAAPGDERPERHPHGGDRVQLAERRQLREPGESLMIAIPLLRSEQVVQVVVGPAGAVEVVEAAQQLGKDLVVVRPEHGLAEVPALIIDVDDATATRIMLADNRTAEFSSRRASGAHRR